LHDLPTKGDAAATPPIPVEFSAVDILRALPDELFARALATWGIEWPGWAELEHRFTSTNAKSLKTYMLKTLKLQGSPLSSRRRHRDR
jgi:hypothetical protein